CTGGPKSVEQGTRNPRHRTWVEGAHASVSGSLGTGTAGCLAATSTLSTSCLIGFLGRAGIFRTGGRPQGVDSGRGILLIGHGEEAVQNARRGGVLRRSGGAGRT